MKAILFGVLVAGCVVDAIIANDALARRRNGWLWFALAGVAGQAALAAHLAGVR